MDKNRQSICFVAPNAYPLLSGDRSIRNVGGAELQQALLARALARLGYRVSMICMDHGQENGLVIDDVTVYTAYGPNEGMPGLRFFHPRLSAIWRCMKQADSDIYYQRGAGMLTGVVAKFCTRHSRLSIFAGASNDDFVKPTPKLRNVRDRWIYQYGLRNASSIFVQNREQKKMLHENYSRESQLLANGYLPPGTIANDANGYILWVSTLRPVKRPQLFLELARALPAYQFVMVGGPGHGHQALYDSISDEAEQIQNLKFIGFVPYSEIDTWFDRARLVVNTSLAEGFPNTFLQSWARAMPAVSFVDSGARLQDGGEVEIHCDSLGDMIRESTEFMENDELWLERGKVVKAHFEKEHSIDHFVSKFQSLISVGSIQHD
jgi:glycosyltransferase involved in cell wall biosynthesis